MVEWLAKETGCSFGFGMFQMGFVPGLFRQAAGAAYAPLGQVIPSDMPGAFAMGMRRPVGVVGAISPWNAALILSARAIAAPIVFGNTVVLSPSEESPYVGGLLWGEIFAEAGLPDGVLNVVTHDRAGAPAIGDELVENPRVRRINFTGSTATGRKLAEAAGRNLKRVVLELGGQNPLIVLADADLDLRGRRGHLRRLSAPGPDLHVGAAHHRRAADRRGVHGRARRPRSPASAWATRASTTTIIGPLINPAALETVSRRVDDVVKAGAKVLAGGGADRHVLPGDAAHRRAPRQRVRPGRDVRPGGLGRGGRERRRGGGQRKRDQLRPRLRHHHHRPGQGPRDRRAGSRRASST